MAQRRGNRRRQRGWRGKRRRRRGWRWKCGGGKGEGDAVAGSAAAAGSTAAAGSAAGLAVAARREGGCRDGSSGNGGGGGGEYALRHTHVARAGIMFMKGRTECVASLPCERRCGREDVKKCVQRRPRACLALRVSLASRSPLTSRSRARHTLSHSRQRSAAARCVERVPAGGEVAT